MNSSTQKYKGLSSVPLFDMRMGLGLVVRASVRAVDRPAPGHSHLANSNQPSLAHKNTQEDRHLQT